MSTLDKDSSVTLRAILRIPPKRLRLFLVASIEGTWVPPGGGPGRLLKSGQRAFATEVGPARREKILERAGATRKSWDNLVRECEKLRLSHRCTRGPRGVVCLFTAPLDGAAAVCPRCAVPLGGQSHPVEGTTRSRSGDSEAAVSNRATSDDAPDPVKVLLQGEGEGAAGTSNRKTALQEVLEREDEEAAYARALRWAKGVKEAAS